MAPSILLTLSTLAVLAFAFPPPTPTSPLYQDGSVGQSPLRPFAASTISPVSYQQIFQDFPSGSSPQGRFFAVSQANGATSNINTLIRFDKIPGNAFECSLKVSFTNPISSSGNTQLTVFSLSNNIASTDTYSTYFPNGGRGTPKGGTNFGTITLTGKGQNSVVNTRPCAASLNFLFQIAADNTGAGTVSFTDTSTSQSINGFFLTYGTS